MLLGLRTARLLVAIVAYFLAVQSVVAARIPFDQWLGQAAFDPLAVICAPGGSMAANGDMASHKSRNGCECATQRGTTVNKFLALPVIDAPVIWAPGRASSYRSFAQDAVVAHRPGPANSGPRGPPA